MKEGKSKMHMLHFCFTFDFIGGRLTYSQEVTVIGWEIGVDSECSIELLSERVRERHGSCHYVHPALCVCSFFTNALRPLTTLTHSI